MKLTDDEMLAIAAFVDEVPWASPLPTVDTESEQEVSAAIVRGERSLWVRELLTAQAGVPALSSELLALTQDAAARGSSWSVFLADADMHAYLEGLNLTYYVPKGSAEPVFLVDSVSVAGVHDWSSIDAGAAIAAAQRLAEVAFVEGVSMAPGEPLTQLLVIARVRGQDVEVLRIRRHSAVLHRNGSSTEFDSGQVADWLLKGAGG